MKNQEPKYLKLARADIGTHEVAGTSDNPRIIAYYADAGHPEIEHDEVAWCAAFVGACLERASYSSSKSLMARSYEKWGKPTKSGGPEIGAIVVMSRGSRRSWQGHVGFCVGWSDTHVDIIGGNQSDQVSKRSYPLGRVLAYRVPVTAKNSRTLIAGRIGAASGGVSVASQSAAAAAQELQPASAELNALAVAAPYLSGLAIIATLITLACIAVKVYARIDDLKNKGR